MDAAAVGVAQKEDREEGIDAILLACRQGCVWKEREYQGAAMRDHLHRAHQRFPAGSSVANRDTAAWLPYAMAALLTLVTLAVFWQVQGHAFVLWDDGLHVYDNPYLQALTFDNVLAFWCAPYAELYMPLTYTLWALTAAVARGLGASPPGEAPFTPQFFHMLNLLVHLVSVLVVWRIVRLLLARTVSRTTTSPPLSLSLIHI